MRSTLLISGVAIGALVVTAGPALADEGSDVVRVSVSAAGGEASDASSYPSVSGDGRFVAFGSRSVNLIPGDYTAGGIFVKEVATGAISRIGTGLLPTLSHDGRYVAFQSSSSTLVPGDTNRVGDVFVHDRQTGTTRRVSVASDGTQANGASDEPTIAAGGRHVVFTSTATNLAAGATGTHRKVFVHDLETGATVEASVSEAGRSGTRDSTGAAVSADGRFVAFRSLARELVAGATWDNYHAAYVRDLATGTTRRLDSGFVQGPVHISADGRFVSFVDERDDIVPGDTNGAEDVFRWDLATDEVIRVDVASDGTESDGPSSIVPHGAPLSADGRFVLFGSAATNLTPGDGNGRTDIFRHDAVEGTTVRVNPDGVHDNLTAASYVGGISADGATAVFMSELAFADDDRNQAPDIFLWRAGGPATE